MRPLPPTASQEKSHIPSWSAKQYLAPLMRPQKFPYIPISLEGTLKFPAPLHLRPFSSHDRDRRVDSTALSRRDSRPSRHTSGWGRSHEEIREVASRAILHAERPRFHGPLLIKTRLLDTSSKASLWMKAQHVGALTPRASSGKTRRFLTQLHKWSVTSWTTREASGVPFLHTRRCLTLLSQL